MEEKAEQLKRASRIVIVGGGALGIRTLSISVSELFLRHLEFATDLKEVYPEKSITLLHSRTRLMPIYPIAVHIAGTIPFTSPILC